ncbi:hypothetical protein SLEP1_g16008 [Rubroshorea leprosula]|uniref:Uncharacterized protein n=1 Tax=Rubroshorea leprosula TaxID=152421 RepID=A0AAV5J020_9ROSI|nr:hypothetical protein SLEP1_g16008 [Rubroshorea leprosula]
MYGICRYIRICIYYLSGSFLWVQLEDSYFWGINDIGDNGVLLFLVEEELFQIVRPDGRRRSIPQLLGALLVDSLRQMERIPPHMILGVVA